MLDDFRGNSNKIRVDKNTLLYNSSMKSGYKIMIYKCIKHILKESMLLLKDLLEPYPYSGWAFSGLLTDGGGGVGQKGLPSLKSVRDILH